MFGAGPGSPAAAGAVALFGGTATPGTEPAVRSLGFWGRREDIVVGKMTIRLLFGRRRDTRS